MKFLILSPYAQDGTKNSGDHLIVQSLINLLNFFSNKSIEYDIVSIAKSTINKIEQFKKIDIKKYKALLIPAFRISIENQEVLNIRLKYIEKALIYNIRIYMIGSSWCIYPGTINQTKFKINTKEKALLKYIIANKKNYLSTRDIYTQKLLENNNIKCDMTGDLALYDINKINCELDFNRLNKIAISLPHNINYYDYCKTLKDQLIKKFNCNVYICTHQYIPNNKKYVDMSGDSDKLDLYNKIDMHIGFRLHGHLWFLRNRKPSFLIAEDGRGYGHLKTFNDVGIHIKKLKSTNIVEMIEDQINSSFFKTRKTLNRIDESFIKQVKIIKKIGEI